MRLTKRSRSRGLFFLFIEYGYDRVCLQRHEYGGVPRLLRCRVHAGACVRARAHACGSARRAGARVCEYARANVCVVARSNR